MLALLGAGAGEKGLEEEEEKEKGGQAGLEASSSISSGLHVACVAWGRGGGPRLLPPSPSLSIIHL